MLTLRGWGELAAVWWGGEGRRLAADCDGLPLVELPSLIIDCGEDDEDDDDGGNEEGLLLDDEMVAGIEDWLLLVRLMEAEVVLV